MVQSIIAARLPVIVYVSPDGARAASAGLFVAQAADVAAMAPQTNIGSATPVQLGPGPDSEVLGRKVENDAAAYVRALAAGHGRNADLAERMVRDAVNVPAERALEENLVDAVAPTERQLLEALDGFRIQGPKAQALDTTGLRVERQEMPFTYELRQFLVNPTVAFLLLLAGLAGLALELASPGTIGPGAVGAIALLLGLYGAVQLPVTLVGALLLVLAVGLFIAETQAPSGGILGAAGVGALIAGGLLLFDTDSPVFDVSVPAAIAGGVAIGGFTLFAASKALSAGRAPARGGPEELIGAVGSVRSPLDPTGQTFVHGALWRARTADDVTLAEGERVVVEQVDGLTLRVRRAGPADRSSEEGAAGGPSPEYDERSSS
jgi:membrane-bound serine protease (ClpP class)